MKTLRFLGAFVVLSFVTSPRMLAAEAAKDQKSEKAEKTCDCGTDKDGKACGVDKDCCCTGKKCSKPEKEEKKS